MRRSVPSGKKHEKKSKRQVDPPRVAKEKKNKKRVKFIVEDHIEGQNVEPTEQNVEQTEQNVDDYVELTGENLPIDDTFDFVEHDDDYVTISQEAAH
jgi:hypothetical protein